MRAIERALQDPTRNVVILVSTPIVKNHFFDLLNYVSNNEIPENLKVKTSEEMLVKRITEITKNFIGSVNGSVKKFTEVLDEIIQKGEETPKEIFKRRKSFTQLHREKINRRKHKQEYSRKIQKKYEVRKRNT